MSGEFRCAFFARDYERSVAFYRDGLELPEVESWDRGPEDRGTIVAAGRGRVEILARSADRPEGSIWDRRPPRGVTLVLEVDDVEALWARVERRRLPIAESLRDQPWGHRSFVVSDPDGVAVYCFEALGGTASGDPDRGG